MFAVLLTLHLHISSSTYSCCSEERRGTVCTLAGNGAADSVDSSNASTAAIYFPHSIVVYPPNSIVVTGNYEHRLRIIHRNGSIGTLAGGGLTGPFVGTYKDSDNPFAARLSRPTGLCVDNEGSLHVCDSSNHRIRTILRNGSVRTLAGSGNGGCVDNADPLMAWFLYPYGIASIIENGQRLIIIGGNYDHRIRVIYANRTVSTLADSGVTGYMNCYGTIDNADPHAAAFCHTIGVAPDRFGNIIVADTYGSRIRKVWRDSSQTGVTTIAGKGPIGTSGGNSMDSDNPLEASFFTPAGVVFDSAGNVLISGVYEHRVRMILVNGSVRTLAGCGPSTGLSTSTTGLFVDNLPLLQARFNAPQISTTDRQGNALLADAANNRVRMLCVSVPSVDSSSRTRSTTAATTSNHKLTTSLTFRSSQLATLSIGNKATTGSATTGQSPTRYSATPSSSHRLLPPSALNPISRLVSSEEAARAVVASGAAAAALAGFAATTSMGHATRMGALMRSVECAFASGELDPPSLVELPLQWSMESQGGSVGSHAGSALLTSAVLVVLPLLMCACVHAILSSCGVSERRVMRSLQCSVLSRYCLLSMAFFAPNVLMSSVVLLVGAPRAVPLWLRYALRSCPCCLGVWLGSVLWRWMLRSSRCVVGSGSCGIALRRARTWRRSAGLLRDVETRRRTLCACASWRMRLRRLCCRCCPVCR